MGSPVKTKIEALQEAVFTFAHDVGTPLMIAGTLAELLASDDVHLTASQRTDVARMQQAYKEISEKVIELRKFASQIARVG
jgi:hypothetical protein